MLLLEATDSKCTTYLTATETKATSYRKRSDAGERAAYAESRLKWELIEHDMMLSSFKPTLTTLP